MRKPVGISSLALRFYRAQGWTLEILRQYLLCGEFIFFDDTVGGFDCSYWITAANSKLDVEKLYSDGHVGELIGKERWGELEGLTDIEILKERNW